MKLRQLEMALQRCAGFEKPRAAWGDTDPGAFAARLLYDAFVRGDIAGKTVRIWVRHRDPCHRGSPAWRPDGAGHRSRPGRSAPQKRMPHCWCRRGSCHGPSGGADAARTCAERIPCDTVVMNPPFGAQKVHADGPIIDCALAIASVTYGIFNAGSTPFVEAYIAGRGKVACGSAAHFPSNGRLPSTQRMCRRSLSRY